MKELDVVYWGQFTVTIVHMYKDGNAAEIEFIDNNNKTIVKTVCTFELRRNK